MASSEDKIINLADRRRIDEQVRAVAQLSNAAEMEMAASEIAKQGAGVLPVLLSHLGTQNPSLRGALGLLAKHLPHDLVVNALRTASLQTSRSDQERITALMLLERYLDEPPDDALYATLGQPEDIALQSLQEVMSEAEHNRLIWIEYFAQLADQPPEVIPLIIQTIMHLAEGRYRPQAVGCHDQANLHERLVDPLRWLALETRVDVSADAVRALGTLRTPQATAALQALLPHLPPEGRANAERSLRKLRLAVGGFTTSTPAVRALVGPPDHKGNQVIWWVQTIAGSQHAAMLGLVLNPNEGILDAFGSEDVPEPQLPEQQALGECHFLAISSRPVGTAAASNGSRTATNSAQRSTTTLSSQEVEIALILLEADPAYARHLLLTALGTHNRAKKTYPPEYRLLHPIIWNSQEDRPLETAEVATPAGVEPALLALTPGQIAELKQHTDELLRHPAFSAWTWPAEQISQLLPQIRRHLRARQSQTAGAGISLEDLRPFMAGPVLSILRPALLSMAEWLSQARDVEAAALATAAAETLGDEAPEEHPFLLALLAVSLARAAEPISPVPFPQKNTASGVKNYK